MAMDLLMPKCLDQMRKGAGHPHATCPNWYTLRYGRQHWYGVLIRYCMLGWQVDSDSYCYSQPALTKGTSYLSKLASSSDSSCCFTSSASTSFSCTIPMGVKLSSTTTAADELQPQESKGN